MFILREAHSGWRYLVILIVVVAILKMLIGWFGKQSWSRLDHILGVSTPIIIDIQWLLGIVLWIMQQRWSGASSLVSWEHPFIMTLALIAGHIGWSRAKRATEDNRKFQNAAIGFLVAGILVGVGVARITGYM